VIDLLIEPVSTDRPGPFPALRRVISERITLPMATLIHPHGDASATSRFYLEPSSILLNAELECVAVSGKPAMREIDGGEYFLELLRPPQSLVIFGGGHDVIPVVAMAKTLGWFVTVVVSHSTIGYRERFATADRLSVGTVDDPFGGETISADAAVVLMTHDYPRDLQLLPRLMQIPPRYLGLLGPRRRAERLVLESPELPADTIDRLYAPVGIDINADTPETIALSIIAEIQAVLAGRPCPSLRDRQGPIYPRESAEADAPYQPITCPISA
jgi:xanthine/CO dehydrogenase XdhC/CoxF family maturation factor